VLSVKVLDFGISKVTGPAAGSADGSMTKTSSLMGSPLYMSPEQMQTPKDVDARSDIWSLGVILHELLTGESPFIADTMPELVLKIVSSPPPPLKQGRPDSPDGLEAVIRKCLEKDRGKRYETVGELAVALLPFGSKRAKASVERIAGVMRGAGMSASALALPPSSDAVNAQEGPSGTAASWGRTGSKAGGSRSAALWVGAAVAAAVGLGSFLYLGKSPSTEGAAASAGPGVTPSAAGDLGAAAAAATESAPTVAPVESAKPSPDEQAVVERTQASTTAPATTSTPRRTGSSAVTRAPATRASAAAAPAKKNPNCDPNFYFDAQGHKHFKRECFQ
jgi:serine/threonine-protein kinase